MTARMTGRQYRAVDATMSDVLGNEDKAPAVSGWTRFRHGVNVEAQINHGRPPFPHMVHAIMTALSGGGWVLVWWAHWMFSARRRYLRSRRAMLREAGLYEPGDLFTPGVPGTHPPRG